MISVKKALVHSILGGYVTAVLSLVVVIATARLLSPEEVGVFAIAGSLMIIAENLKNFGVGPYVIRKKELSPEDIRSALGISIIISWGLGFLMCLLSEPASAWFENADLRQLVLLLSIGFFFSPYISVSSAFLQRNLGYKTIAIIEFVAGLSQILSLFIFIQFDFSYFAIALAMITNSLTQFAGHLLVNYKNVSLIPRFSNLRLMGRFGFFITFINLFTRLNLIVPDLIIGKLGTPTMVALFSRAIGILDFAQVTLVKGIAGLSLPYLSRVNRENGDIVGAYTKASELTSSILLPFMALVFVLSDEVILFFFGNQWVESAPIIEVLAVWATVKSFHSLSNSIFISKGKETIAFYIAMGVTVVLSLLVFFLFEHGLEAIALAFVFANILRIILVSYYAKKLFGIIPLQFAKYHAKCVSCGAICMLSALFAKEGVYMLTNNNFIILIFTSAVSLAAWLIAAYLLKLQLLKEIGVEKIAERFKKKKIV
ncbi:oligosaccharide flippase family protein [Alteromonas sp. P256]|uniref:oligosaccharide flippase family protein n=1 Tax=Alteromonas sp. P256 TaxID=3117399 RepID=UPI002FE083F6